jgi:hypothetical protein
VAVEERNIEALELLLAAGADPRLRTRIDDFETPRELAQRAGLTRIVELPGARDGKS